MRKIQNDYIRLVKDIFSKQELEEIANISFKDIPSFAFRYFNECSSRFNTPYGQLTNSEYKTISLLKDIKNFWLVNSNRLVKSIEKEKPYSVTLPLSSIKFQIESLTKRLGIYFDTISIVDPLHIPEENKIEEFAKNPQSGIVGNFLILIEEAIQILKLDSLNSSNMEKTLFLIIPEKLERAQQYELHSANLSVMYLNRLFNLDSEFSSFFEYATESKKDSKLVEKRISNKSFYNELINRYDHLGKRKMHFIDSETGLHFTKETCLSEMEIDDVYSQFLNKISNNMNSIHSIFLSSKNVFSDPIIPQLNSDVYGWLVKETEMLTKTQGYNIEGKIISESLIGNNFDFLEAIDLRNLVRIRENGQFEELRSKLRIRRWELRNSTMLDFNEATENFYENFKVLMNEYEELYLGLKKEYKSSIIKSLPYGIVSMGLGLSSILIPELLILSIGSLAAGVIMGGKSVKDYISDYNNKKKLEENLKTTPVAILYDAYKNTSDNNA